MEMLYVRSAHPQHRDVGRHGRVGHVHPAVVSIGCMLAGLLLEDAGRGGKSVGTRQRSTPDIAPFEDRASTRPVAAGDRW